VNGVVSRNVDEAEKVLQERIVEVVLEHAEVDAVYLFGSRASGRTHDQSDWDIGLLFSAYEHDPLERVMRPQHVEAALERTLKLYGRIQVVDVEIVPPPLQYNIIRGLLLFEQNTGHIMKIEHSIISKVEKDYDNA
jgi:predicted nucleotidyltransferase